MFDTWKVRRLFSKPFQSRSKGEIPSEARRKERLSCVKLNQAFLSDSWRRTFHVLLNVSGSAHEKFGVMIRFDNVLFANVSGIHRSHGPK